MATAEEIFPPLSSGPGPSLSNPDHRIDHHGTKTVGEEEHEEREKSVSVSSSPSHASTTAHPQLGAKRSLGAASTVYAFDTEAPTSKLNKKAKKVEEEPLDSEDEGDEGGSADKRTMNRLAADRYRRRKKEQLQTLADKCEALTKENSRLEFRAEKLEEEVNYLKSVLLIALQNMRPQMMPQQPQPMPTSIMDTQHLLSNASSYSTTSAFSQNQSQISQLPYYFGLNGGFLANDKI